jgi:hypothetical protein
MVRVNGRMISPTDSHHDLCARCYERAISQFHNQFKRSKEDEALAPHHYRR